MRAAVGTFVSGSCGQEDSSGLLSGGPNPEVMETARQDHLPAPVVQHPDHVLNEIVLPGKHARMFCAFAYTRIQATIRARSYEAGIEVLDGNPAYSSIIGKYKFVSRYGLSRPQPVS